MKLRMRLLTAGAVACVLALPVNSQGVPTIDVTSLAKLADAAKAGTGKIVISGFHDASGDPAKNAELAKQRALAVRDALKAAGVAEDRFEMKKPEQINAGTDADARRVEAKLI